MKEKIIRIFNEKKELFIFVGVVLLVFGTVLGISALARNNGVKNVAKTIEDTSSTTENTTTENITTEPPIIFEKMISPIAGEYVIVRYFFDRNDNNNLVNAVRVANGFFEESKGVSFANSEGSSFSCLAVFSGEVIDVSDDPLNGKIVEIKHDDNVITRYSSLSNVSVNIGDHVTQGQIIGTSGTALADEELSSHVHLEMMNNGSYINPLDAMNNELKTITEKKEK